MLDRADPKRGALRLLLRLLEGEASRLRRISGAAADDFENLLRARFLTEDNLVYSTICDECGEGESALVEVRNGRTGILCGIEGFVERDPESLAAFRLERDGFARALREALTEGEEGGASFSKISDHLWRLGGFSRGGASGTAFLALRLKTPDDFVFLDQAITSRPRPSVGAVFTLQREAAPGLRLSLGYRLIPCAEALQLTEGGLRLRIAALAEAFPEIARFSPELRDRGRPGRSEETERVIRHLQEQGSWPKGTNACIRAIQEAWSGVHPASEIPAISTIKDHLRKLASVA